MGFRIPVVRKKFIVISLLQLFYLYIYIIYIFIYIIYYTYNIIFIFYFFIIFGGEQKGTILY